MPETLKLPYEEATSIVEDQIMDYLLAHPEPAKTTDLIPAVSVAAVTPRVVRGILSHSNRFVSMNRRWDIATRHDPGALTLERALNSILQVVGRPVTLRDLAAELAHTLGRTPDYYAEILPKFLRERSWYVPLRDGSWGWHEWFLKVGPDEDAVLFDNFFMSPLEEEVEAIRPVALRFSWNPANIVDSALAFIQSLDQSISNTVLSFFAWKATPDTFNPLDFFAELETLPGAVLLCGGRWCPTQLKREFEKVYHDLGQREEPVAAEEEEAVREERIHLDADDLEQVYKIMAGSDRSWRVPELVETAFDLTEGDRGYEDAVQQLNLMMLNEERFLWVGTDRWREAGTLPEFVFDVPDQLTIQQYIFEDENGDPIDIELDDRGIDEGLQQAASVLLVQDFGDRDSEGVGIGERLESFQLWVTLHHRETGTLPVLPAYRGLFPEAPDIIEVMVRPNSGPRFPVWVNDTLETIFGFGQWFIECDIPMSGAVFTLSRSHVEGEYRLDYTGAAEPRLVIDSERLDELEMLKIEAESENPLPTFEIIRRVMAPYAQKGLSFVRLWTEVNAVRRTRRRMIASILSAYQCFVPVTRGSDIWWYDEKRAHLGINKQKRKFIRNAQ